jgi:hypothetical protein
MVEMFGSEFPMEAVKLIWNAPDGQTLAEIRRKLREIAAATRTVHDPFTGKDVQVSNRLTDRLRGKYAVGPVMENGEPEFGWRQHEVPPIQIEAAAHIEQLEERMRGADALIVLWETRATRAEARVEALEAVLREYEDDYCEGWCKDAPPQATFDCGGCRARAAIASKQD